VQLKKETQNIIFNSCVNIFSCISCPDAYRRCTADGCQSVIRVEEQFCHLHGGRARDDNIYCDGEHPVSGGCEDGRCKGRRYCFIECATCPSMLKKFEMLKKQGGKNTDEPDFE
jgi:hypothetical protein